MAAAYQTLTLGQRPAIAPTRAGKLRDGSGLGYDERGSPAAGTRRPPTVQARTRVTRQESALTLAQRTREGRERRCHARFSCSRVVVDWLVSR
jgi:hypothetical protein